jgi:hypothetical protein
MAKYSKSQHQKLVIYRDYINKKLYTEAPISVTEFLSNPHYLGNSFGYGKLLYPCWAKALKEIFQNDQAYINVFTGATSTGKTVAAYAGIAYVLYRHLILRDIWSFYQMSDGGKIGIAFFNLTKTLSSSKGFDVLQNFLIKSDWFRQHGTVKGGGTYIEFPQIEYVLASPNSAGFSTVGHHIIGAVMDEVDSPNASPNSKQKTLMPLIIQ